MTAMVDEFADIEDGSGFLLQGVQWANSIVAGAAAHASGEELKETMARLENAAGFIGLQRDRGHGRVTIDAAGDAVIHYALTDEVDVRSRGARSRPRFGFTPPAERRRLCRWPRRRPAGGLATTLRRSSRRCSESRSALAATSCSRPIR
jgi:hypothetical protein